MKPTRHYGKRGVIQHGEPSITSDICTQQDLSLHCSQDTGHFPDPGYEFFMSPLYNSTAFYTLIRYENGYVRQKVLSLLSVCQDSRTIWESIGLLLRNFPLFSRVCPRSPLQLEEGGNSSIRR